MDSQTLMRRLQPFVELGQREGLPFEIVGLEDAIPGLAHDNYIVRIVAPWSAGKSFDHTMDQLIDLLWRSTSTEQREGIAMLQVSSSQEIANARYVSSSLAIS